MIIKVKNNKLNFIKIKVNFFIKDFIIKEREELDWEKIFLINLFNKGFVLEYKIIYKKLILN